MFAVFNNLLPLLHSLSVCVRDVGTKLSFILIRISVIMVMSNWHAFEPKYAAFSLVHEPYSKGCTLFQIRIRLCYCVNGTDITVHITAETRFSKNEHGFTFYKHASTLNSMLCVNVITCDLLGVHGATAHTRSSWLVPSTLVRVLVPPRQFSLHWPQSFQ